MEEGETVAYRTARQECLTESVRNEVDERRVRRVEMGKSVEGRQSEKQ